MKRGEVWWASLPEPVGSGPGLRRPVLVLQSNQFNHSFISTVVVAIITSNINLADAPGNVRLGKSDSGLPKASVINVAQLLTIDRGLLTDRVRSVPGAVMTKVDQGLRMVLAL